jgi:type II secretory pathway pseudopilin PulG
MGARRAFSLVELLVVAGVMMILIGLAMPSVGGAMQRARQTQDLAQLQQNERAASAYLTDWKDVFPLADGNAQRCASLWFQALVRGGHLDGDLSSEPDAVTAADPYGVRKFGSVRFLQSVCMTYDVEHMTRGRTVPVQFQTARPVHAGEVVYPSLKGWMLMGHLRPWTRRPTSAAAQRLSACPWA